MSSNLVNTVCGTKRLLGRKFSEAGEDLKQFPFKVEERNDLPVVTVNYKNQKKKYRFEEITAMTISKLQQLAEDDLGLPVKKAVISDFFLHQPSERELMIDAGTIAGLDMVQIVNEGTASAIHYALENRISREKNILVLHIGAGTIDVSVCGLEKAMCEVKATAGDTSLGDMDFDKCIMDYCVEDIEKKLRRDIREHKEAFMMLSRCCERAKVELSEKESASIQFNCDGIEYKKEICRTILDELCTELIKKFMRLVNRCLRDEQLDYGNVDDILLVGGCTRMPAHQQRLKSCLDEIVSVKVKPDEFVVGGAAYVGALSSGLVDGLNFRDVVNLQLNWEYKISGSPSKSKVKSKRKNLISKNSRTPTKDCQKTISLEKGFLQPNDRKIVLKVFEAGMTGEVAGDGKLLGKFECFTRGSDTVTIKAKTDVNGILHLSAEGNEGKHLTIMGDSGRFNTGEISKLRSEAATKKLQDQETWKLIKNNLRETKIRQTLEVAPDRLEVEHAEEQVTGTLNEVADTLNKVSKKCCRGSLIYIIL